jgi:NitT/TauT family transport system permease protein
MFDRIKNSLFYVLVMAISWLTIFLDLMLPDAKRQASNKWVFIFILMVLFFTCFVYFIAFQLGKISHEKVKAIFDIMLVFSIISFLWMLIAGKLNALNPLTWPSPGKAFEKLWTDYPVFLKGVSLSMLKLAQGFFLAVALAIPMGVIVGWFKRLFNIIYPIAKFIAPIPPVVYIPYALVIFPTIYQASIFIIFIGAFWPTFVNTVYGVSNVDKRLIDAAYTLGASHFRVLKKVVFPAATPTIFAGILIGLILGFVMLTVAEQVGATAGIGYYLVYYSDVSDFDRVVADIFVIGVCVFVWTFIFDKVQEKVLRWQKGITR